MRNPLNRRLGAACVGLGLAAASATVLTGPAATAAPAAPKAGNTSLAEVLGTDGVKFDKNGKDFDIVEAAVFAVLEAKPESPVGLLADGKTRLTAFVPTDNAFRLLVKDLTGKTPAKEAGVLKQVVKAAGSIDTIETILLYHVVAGKTLTSPKVLAAEGQKIETAMGKSFRVHVTKKGVVLNDKDKNDANPKVVVLDINRGNKQVGHAINRVLRPLDL
jgi:uncharacterized surface protein with fasciclin (FAS1) repeats